MVSLDEDRVRLGVRNLVRNCLAVGENETVLLLNGYGDVDRGLVEVIEDEVKAAGGRPYSLWMEPAATSMQEMPVLVGNAVLACDKLVMNVNLNRVVLLDHLKGNGHAQLVRVNNRTRTPERIATQHALFDWRLVMALAGRIEEIASRGQEWRITTPHGTDMRGRVAKGSEVADSFFAQDAEMSRMERVFPGEVYAPVGSSDAQGIIAFDHPGLADKDLFHVPLRVAVSDNMVRDVEWREEIGPDRADGGVQTVWTRDQFMQLLEANEARYGHEKTYTLDSWHGGMHPKAEKRPGQLSDTKTMHFHIGRVPNTLSAYVSDQTVCVDETTIMEDGEMVLLQESEMQAIARDYGVEV